MLSIMPSSSAPSTHIGMFGAPGDDQVDVREQGQQQQHDVIQTQKQQHDQEQFEVTFAEHKKQVLMTSDDARQITTGEGREGRQVPPITPPLPPRRVFGRRHRRSVSGDVIVGDNSNTDNKLPQSFRCHHRRSYSLGTAPFDTTSASANKNDKTESGVSNSASGCAAFFNADSSGGDGGYYGAIPMNPFEAANVLQDDTAASVGDDASVVLKTISVPDASGHDLTTSLPDMIVAFRMHGENSDYFNNDMSSRSIAPMIGNTDDLLVVEASQNTEVLRDSDKYGKDPLDVSPRERHDTTQRSKTDTNSISDIKERWPSKAIQIAKQTECLSSEIKSKKNKVTFDNEDNKAQNESHRAQTASSTDDPPAARNVSDSDRQKSRSVLTAGIESFKYLYSLALLIFSVVLVMGAIFTEQTTLTAPATTNSTTNDADSGNNINEGNNGGDDGFPAIGAFFVFWFLILWLAFLEGGQGALVGLQPIDRNSYKESHPRSYKNTRLVHGEVLDRFIVGRQFLVVLVVFVIQLMSSAVSDIQLWGLNSQITEIFLKSGLALMVVTIVLGQLTAQLNATNCMLDFINNYFMLYFVSYLSLIIEFSGLLHGVYLVQWVFTKITEKDTSERSSNDECLASPIDVGKSDNLNVVVFHNVTPTCSDEEIGITLTVRPQEEPISDEASAATWKRSKFQAFFFALRVAVSVTILGFAFSVTLSALFQRKTTMWDGVPPAASVAIFFLLMIIVGLMEGAQIALFAVLKSSQDKLSAHSPVAHRNCDLVFRDDNLPAFLIGRQICVTICTFIIARITTLNVEDGDGNIFGVSDGVQAFFNTGLLGAIITTVVSSLAWRIVANAFPVAFLSNPFITPMIRICLFLEASGICSSAWVVARLQRRVVRYQPDNAYLERAADEVLRVETLNARDRDIDRFVNVSKFSFSLALLIFSMILLSCSVFTRQTNVTATSDMGGMELPPIAIFIMLTILIIWLNFLEGAQGSLIGLQNVEKMKYAESHPRTFRSINASQHGDNLQRFIVGRQFLVLTVIFLSQWITSPLSEISVLGLPTVVNEIFLSSGLALMITVIVVGQLSGEVNAATCMLDFTNNFFTLHFVTHLSMLIEQTGLLHSVYAFQIMFSKVAGQPIPSREARKSAKQRFCFWFRVCFSLSVLAFALAVTFDGLLRGKTTIWGVDISGAAAVVTFLALIVFVGLLEGLQLAVLSVTGNEEALLSRRIAYANYALTMSDLQSVLIGRQILVTVSFFILARISTPNIKVDLDDNVFGVSNAAQGLFNTGMLGALIATIIASLTWRLIASSFPLLFMSNPLINLIIRLCRVVNDSGICCASWMLGRWAKIVAGYQPDEVYLDGAERQGPEPITRRDKDIDVTVSFIKYIFSTGLLAFAVAVTLSLILTKQTELSKNTHPAVALVLIVLLLGWLGMMEGGQGCLVGIQGIPSKLYASSHPKTFKNANLAHHGNNMARFIVGRQFLVVLVVFIINVCGSPIDGSNVFGLPSIVNDIFVGSNLSLILITVIVGQLMAQVNAASCMLDFINSYFMLYGVTYVSLMIEWSGLLHSVYLIQIIFYKVSGTNEDSKKQPRTGIQKAFFWARVLLSLAILVWALCVTLAALIDEKTTAWEGVPGVVSIVIFFSLMILAGLLEGMQIALFAVVHLPEDELGKSRLAKVICQLSFKGKNLSSFLIGRQILVTLCTFVIAQITTLNVDVSDGDNIFGVSNGLQTFFNTGLLGAIITTIIGSLAWRVIAASFPIAFIGNPLIYMLLRLCLLLQASGVCASALLLALVNKQIAGFQPDDKYVGKKDEWPNQIPDGDIEVADVPITKADIECDKSRQETCD